MATKKRDALGPNKCGTCVHYHNPEGLPNGYCVAHPPTPVMVTIAPMAQPSIVNPQNPPMQRGVPIVPAYFPEINAETHGCHEHEPVAKLN